MLEEASGTAYSQIGIYSVAAVTFIVMNIYRQIWALIDHNCIRIERCGRQRERSLALSSARTYNLCIFTDFLLVPNIRPCLRIKFKGIKRPEDCASRSNQICGERNIYKLDL